MPPPGGVDSNGDHQDDEQQEQDQPHLLDLPQCVLVGILSRLDSAADVFAAAAACSALHATLRGGSTWPRVSDLRAHVWTPALPASLGWAATAFPQLRRLDLGEATAVCDADLLPLSRLSSLTALRLDGLWQVTVSSGEGLES